MDATSQCLKGGASKRVQKIQQLTDTSWLWQFASEKTADAPAQTLYWYLSVDRQSPLWTFWYVPTAELNTREASDSHTPEVWFTHWHALQVQDKTHAGKASHSATPLEQYFKRHLEGAKWIAVKAIQGERILQFTFTRLSLTGEVETFFLMLELTPKYANFFLLDAHEKIITASRFITMADNRTRQQLMYQPYQPPPQPEGRWALDALGTVVQALRQVMSSPCEVSDIGVSDTAVSSSIAIMPTDVDLSTLPDPSIRAWIQACLEPLDTAHPHVLRRRWLTHLRQTLWGATVDVLRQAIRYATAHLTEDATCSTWVQCEAFMKLCEGLQQYRAWMLERSEDTTSLSALQGSGLEHTPLWCLVQEAVSSNDIEPAMATDTSHPMALVPMGLGLWFQSSQRPTNEKPACLQSFTGYVAPHEALMVYLTNYWQAKAYHALYTPLYLKQEKLYTQLQKEYTLLVESLEHQDLTIQTLKDHATRLLWAYNTQRIPHVLEPHTTIVLPDWDDTVPTVTVTIEHRSRPTHLAEHWFEKAKKLQKQQEGRLERCMILEKHLQSLIKLQHDLYQAPHTSWTQALEEVRHAWQTLYHLKKQLMPQWHETPKTQKLLQRTLGMPPWVWITDKKTQKHPHTPRHTLPKILSPSDTGSLSADTASQRGVTTALVGLRLQVSTILQKYQALYDDHLEGVPEALRVQLEEASSAASLQVWIGKNQRSNHHLLTKIAHPEDHWLHHAHKPSGHALVRLEALHLYDKTTHTTLNTWDLLARHAPKLMDILLTEVAWHWATLQPEFVASLHTPLTFLDTIPVIHCPMKYVLLIPNHIGLVQYSHEKRL